MRGRPATPTDIKRLKGTFRPDRIKGAEPKIEYVVVPEPPKNISEIEKKYWLKFKNALDILGITGVPDLDAFEMLVTSRADYEIARSAEEKNYKTLIALSKEVRSWMTVFGLTPASRMLVSKLAGDKKEEVDEVFDFLM